MTENKGENLLQVNKRNLVVSAHQPAYMPWLGLLHKVWLSDVFIIFDCVGYEKGSFINRNRFSSPSGGWSWLTVPVNLPGGGQPLIKDVLIDNSKSWKKKHLAHIWHTYRKSSHFDQIFPRIEEFYSKSFNTVPNH